ncbi:MAG: right-handed parallel beta-helix repeat-containing protein [Flavobacteriales bacterium]|nr:right-handed parallel beta-helix repeat-containing protein [Flavobacteriales bacterium]
MTKATSKNILENIFSNDFFKNIDTETLVKRHNSRFNFSEDNLPAVQTVAPKLQTESLISEIPPEGILLEIPGKYTFAGNLSWSPTSPSSAITIVGIVELDLKGFTLSINVPIPNNAEKFNGITIKNAADVTVKNGTIDGASYYGLCAKKSIGLTVIDIIIKNIKHFETTVKGLAPCGILIATSELFKVKNCKVHDIAVTAPSCAGILVYKSSKGEIENCAVNNMTNKDGGVLGFSYDKSSEIRTKSCTSENFQSHFQGQTKTAGHTAIGYLLMFCHDIEYTDCNSLNLKGCCDDCHGMSLFITSNVVVNNFKAKNIIGGVCPVHTCAKATGLEVYGIRIQINNCDVESINAIRPQDKQSAGFSAWGAMICFTNCNASNVQVLDENCLPNTAYGYGTGFGWAPDPRPELGTTGALSVTYNNCTTSECQVGFDTWNHIDSLWVNIETQNCSIPLLVQPLGTIRTFLMDGCSESPSGMPESVPVQNIAKGNTHPKLQLSKQFVSHCLSWAQSK